MKEPLQITPGKAQVVNEPMELPGQSPYGRDWCQFVIVDGMDGGEGHGDTSDEANANATLYADAHNTYQSLPVLPSELKRRLEEVQAAIERLKAQELYGDGPADYGFRTGYSDCIKSSVIPRDELIEEFFKITNRLIDEATEWRDHAYTMMQEAAPNDHDTFASAQHCYRTASARILKAEELLTKANSHGYGLTNTTEG